MIAYMLDVRHFSAHTGLIKMTMKLILILACLISSAAADAHSYDCCTNSNFSASMNKVNPVAIGMSNFPGLKLIHHTPASANEVCNGQALIKVTFDKANNDSKREYCQREPACGHTMLKVTLTLASDRSGWLMNVGDSITNNGYAGDGNTQTNDAEAQLLKNNVAVYKSDKCSSESINRPGFLLPTAQFLDIYIGNNYIKFVQRPGCVRKEVCAKCLFALNGQADPSPGEVNEDVYIAINRVVTSRSGRVGSGVCGVSMSWMCPVSYLNEADREAGTTYQTTKQQQPNQTNREAGTTYQTTKQRQPNQTNREAGTTYQTIKQRQRNQTNEGNKVYLNNILYVVLLGFLYSPYFSS